MRKLITFGSAIGGGIIGYGIGMLAAMRQSSGAGYPAPDGPAQVIYGAIVGTTAGAYLGGRIVAS